LSYETKRFQLGLSGCRLLHDRMRPPMRTEVYFAPAQVEESQFREKNVVVVDVLRASTTIVTALNHGAREVIPVATIEAAVKIAGGLFGETTLLCGERDGRTIEGFQLGNSPGEYTEENVKGKTLVFTSTNGSIALTKGKYALRLVVAGFVNMSAVVEFLQHFEDDLSILCAGKLNAFCLEDAVCAGMLVSRLMAGEVERLELSDATEAALRLFESFGRNLLQMLQRVEHGKYLQEIGFGSDLEVCAQVDSIPILPVMEDNVIRLRR
jgi:2-phosphosulfolactate phosphatase